MRRAAHLVASILIVVTAIGESCAIVPLLRLIAATDEAGIVDVLHSTPAAEVVNESAPARVIAAHRFHRSDSIAIAASATQALTVPALGWYRASSGTSACRAVEHEAARGRAPPLC